MTTNTYKALLLFVFVSFILTLGFYRNQWQMAGKKRFYEWREQSSYMLVGRLARSQQFGFFSDSALLGFVDGTWPLPPGIVEHQYNVYLNRLEHNSYLTYNSTIGFQGVLFGFFDKYTNYPENFNLKIFSGFSSTLSALAMAAIVTWLFLEFGLIPALAAFAFMVLSEWLTLFGGDIYWQLWAFYLPTLSLFYFFRYQRNTQIIPNQLHLMLIVFCSVLLKVMFTGFEFITVALLMIYSPIIYYAVLRGWGLKNFIFLSVRLGISALVGVLTGFGILLIQVAGVLKGFGPAISFIYLTFSRRTHGDADLFSVESESLNANMFSVIWKYMTGRAINLSMWIQEDSQFSAFQDIGYLPIFIFFVIASLTFLLVYFYDRSSVKKSSLALFGMMWFSLISPFSWLIFFKAHAYLHGHLDYIIWQMPFTFIGFAFCGDVFRVFILRFEEWFRNLRGGPIFEKRKGRGD